MRELKFRQWNSIKKRWHYFEFINGRCSGVENANLDVYPISQFTGLKDKNGKEIYEGDIMRGSHCEYIQGIRHDDYPDRYPEGIVVFGKYKINTGVSGHGEGYSCKEVVGWHVDDYRNKNPEGLEIIGNIYEHSYLLDNRK